MTEAALQYDVDPEVLTNFLDESEESIATLDGLFVEMEQRPKDKKIIEGIFRVAHSIKGLAAFLSLGFVKELTHELETVLDDIRKDRLCVDSGVIDGLLAGFDELSGMLSRVRAGRAEVEDESRLHELLAGIRQLSDSRDSKPAVEGRKTEDGRQKTEDGGQKTDDSSLVPHPSSLIPRPSDLRPWQGRTARRTPLPEPRRAGQCGSRRRRLMSSCSTWVS